MRSASSAPSARRAGRGGRRRHRAPPGRGRARRCSAPTASGTSQRIGRPSATRRADHRGGDVDPRHREEAHARRGTPGQRRELVEDIVAARAPRARRPRARRARARPRARASPAGPAAWSAPTMKVRSSPGSRSCSALRVSTVKDGPARSTSMRRDLDARRVADREPAQLEPELGRPGRPRSALCGGVWTGSSSTRSSSSAASASWAHTMCPTCGGLNVPPRRPTRATQGRTWPSPSTRYLNVHSSRRPIGPRACSFWVELPISAPIPNSPPSVKRVEALT